MGIRVFNVAEKHSVARDVSAILSRNQGGLRSRDGRSVYNKIFEFNYQIQGQQCHMIFTSIHGHLMELEFEDRYRKWHSCDPLDLYTAPVKKHVPQDKLNIKQTLEEEARKCQWLILWLDCDREGENIAFEVVQVCTDANRQLNVWRARFSSIIEREIHQSIQRLGRPNQLFSDAVDVRQEIDLRIGASFTRFQTMLLRDAFVLDFAADGRNVVLSYGPCQFPTLGFVVERYWEIQSHEPEEFWTINCTHNSDDCTASFNWMRGHLFDYTCAVIIYEMCIQEPTATVTQVRQRETLKRPPHPLSTIELEKRASRYFRMGAKQTMKVAEELYLSGFISYPRTETDSFSPETDLHTIVQDQQQHPVWGSYAQRLLDPGAGLWRNPSNGGHDDKAHPPIHPTKFSAGESNWTPDHHKLYELVVRHFLACVSQPAVGAETTVDIDIAGELFCTTGRVILAKNYLEVYRFESWGGSIIPTYTLGNQFIPTTLTLDSGVTRPPPLLSEADLMECMDKAGIGTDATMHDHIQKLLDRYYATKDMNTTRFTPTHLGEALVMGYDDMGYELWKPYLRAMMESDMKAVSIGTKNKAEVLATCLQQMKACFQDWFDREKIIGDEEHPPAWIAKLNKAKLFEAMDVFFERANRPVGNEQHTFGEVVRRCDRCQESDMVLKRKPDGNFMVGCLGYPQCKNVVWLPGPISEASVTTTICSTCTPGPVFKIQFKFRRLEIPMHFSTEHLGCVGGCDDILKQLIETCGTGSRDILGVSGRGRGSNTPSSNFQQSAGRGRGSNTPSSNFQQSAGRGRGSNTPSSNFQQSAGRGRGSNTSSSNVQQSAGRGRGSNTSSSNIQQSIPRQRTCTQCRQTGHTSNNCPSQASRSSSAWSQGTNQQGEPSIPCGTCGNPCTLRTANTESNRGKKFYSCQGCNFFIWEDVYNERNAPSSNYSNRASAQSRRGGRGRGGRSGRGVSNTNGGNFVSARSVSNTNGGNFVSATGEPITDRRCFICQDPSHFANVCPSRGM